MNASDVQANSPRDGAETLGENVFAPSAPYWAHSPVGFSESDPFESDDGSTERQPESELKLTTAAERSVLRSISDFAIANL